MDVFDVLRKLEPVMPARVKRWRRSLDLAEPEMKALLSKEVLSVAYREFGDFRSKLLLSLPPEHVARGQLNLGTVVYDKVRWDAGISTRELVQNMAVFGRSGAGKTNLAFHLLLQLAELGVPVLFLDWKRTARHLLPLLGSKLRVFTLGRGVSPLPFNPFIPPPGLEPLVYASFVVDVMGDAYTLGDAARSVLVKALRGLYSDGRLPPTAESVRERVESVPDKERVRGWKSSVFRALDTLASIDLNVEVADQERMVNSLLRGASSIELDGLAPSNRKFLLPLLCLWLYYVKLSSETREELSLAVFLEEAHHYFPGGSAYKETVMTMLLRQCREVGVGMIVLDQHPSLMPAAALGNTYCSVCLNLKDPRDVNRAASLSLLGEVEKRHLTLLPVGEGVVKLQDRWQRPFLVRAPLVSVKKGSVRDEHLQARKEARNGGLSALSAPVRASKGERGLLGRFRACNVVLSEEDFSFLSDVLAHPTSGVDARYKRLGWSGDKGHRLKSLLLEKGVLEERAIAVGRTRRKVVRVPVQIKKALGFDCARGDEASLAHEFWKHWYAEKLREDGYRVRAEAPRNVGRVDVLAFKNGKSLAVEIETGRSTVVWNVKQNLFSSFSRVLVVATSGAVLEKVEGQLGKAGLLGGRVEVVLRGDC